MHHSVLFFNRVLLVIVSSLLGRAPAIDFDPCIRYQTFRVSSYGMSPFQATNQWFTHTLHFTPRITTRVAIRSVRLLGCCSIGYKYYPIVGCLPVCDVQCSANSRCTAPNECSCNVGFYKASAAKCLPIGQVPENATDVVTTTERTAEKVTFSRSIEETTTEQQPTPSWRQTTTIQLSPCNGSCSANEECSLLDDVCVCERGYQRSGGSCVPQCSPECDHGNCVAPNACSCWPHYKRVDATSCRLECTEHSCVYGRCNDQGVCECAPGFLNNGNGCAWAGDAILPAPDRCDCWTKFTWPETATETTAPRCIPLCEDPGDLDCIHATDCQCYEGFLACHGQMYTCSRTEATTTPVTATFLPVRLAPDESSSATKLTVLIVAFVAAMLVLGAVLWAWQNRRQWFFCLPSYRRMEGGPENE